MNYHFDYIKIYLQNYYTNYLYIYQNYYIN